MQDLPSSGGNATLSGAVQVLGVISELGKALPFVAPAFILLKVIIDVETRAQEVDLKCNDATHLHARPPSRTRENRSHAQHEEGD